MNYSFKEYSKTTDYKVAAANHAKWTIFLSISTLIFSGFTSEISVGFLRAAIVLIVWCLFGASLLIALPSFCLISWIKLRCDGGHASSILIYTLLKYVIYVGTIFVTIATTLIALGRL